MFGQSKTREFLHRAFGSAEEKSRASAINTMTAAHIYENWGNGPAKGEPQKWPDYLKEVNPFAPDPKKKNVLHKLFGAAEKMAKPLAKVIERGLEL